MEVAENYQIGARSNPVYSSDYKANKPKLKKQFLWTKAELSTENS